MILIIPTIVQALGTSAVSAGLKSLIFGGDKPKVRLTPQTAQFQVLLEQFGIPSKLAAGLRREIQLFTPGEFKKFFFREFPVAAERTPRIQAAIEKGEIELEQVLRKTLPFFPLDVRGELKKVLPSPQPTRSQRLDARLPSVPRKDMALGEIFSGIATGVGDIFGSGVGSAVADIATNVGTEFARQGVSRLFGDRERSQVRTQVRRRGSDFAVVDMPATQPIAQTSPQPPIGFPTCPGPARQGQQIRAPQRLAPGTPAVSPIAFQRPSFPLSQGLTCPVGL